MLMAIIECEVINQVESRRGSKIRSDSNLKLGGQCLVNVYTELGILKRKIKKKGPKASKSIQIFFD